MSEILSKSIEQEPENESAKPMDEYITDQDDFEEQRFTTEILNPREDFEVYDEGIQEGDYLGARYLASLEREARIKRLGAPEMIVRREIEVREYALTDTRSQLNKIASDQRRLEQLITQPVPIPKGIMDRLDLPDGRDLTSILKALANAPDDILGEFIIYNKEYVDEMAGAKLELLEASKNEFWKKVIEAKEKQNLPIDKAQLKVRMDTFINIRLVDPLAFDLLDRGGDYKARERQIRISAAGDIKKITFHELLHFLSGHTFSERIFLEDGKNMDEDYRYIRSMRVGLVNYAHVWGDSVETRRWINEAVTEQLTQILLSEEGEKIDFSNLNGQNFFNPAWSSGTYQAERNLLEVLMRPVKDNGYTALVKAYFEDHLPSRQPGRRNVARRQFYRGLQRAYGKDAIALLRYMDSLYAKKDFQGMQGVLAGRRLARVIFKN